MILLINSAGISEEKSYAARRINSRILPYPSAVIVAHLRKRGFRVVHRDLRNSVSPRMSSQLPYHEFVEWLESGRETTLMKEFMERAFMELPDLNAVKMVGFSIFHFRNYLYALALAKKIKALHPDLPICFGGAFVTIRKLEIPSYVDFYIRGNGGGPICHLADHCVGGLALDEELAGLCYIKSGQLIDNGRNQEAADLEEMPDYSDLDLERYLTENLWEKNEKVLFVPYRTSLGCSNQCSFCTGRLVDGLRFKNADKVVQEIKTLKKIHDKAVISFADSSLNNNPRVLSGILDKLAEQGVDIKWFAYVNVKNMSFELLEKFASRGCISLYWGLESISRDMIGVFNKNYDAADAEAYLRKASALGIKNQASIIFNGPGEKIGDIVAIERFVGRLLREKNVIFRFYKFFLEEGTLMQKYPERFNIEILDRPGKDDYTRRESIRWKDAGLSPEAFEKKQAHHAERIRRLRRTCDTSESLRRKKLELPMGLVLLVSAVLYRFNKIKRALLGSRAVTRSGSRTFRQQPLPS
jgi:radical SAM superfamily enzyme YgiQ (UPF0313 family)